jgi:hypothetical protein
VVKPHDHSEADRRRWTLDGLRSHVREFHPGLEPPGSRRAASFRTLSAAHRQQHPEPLAGRGDLLSLDGQAQAPAETGPEPCGCPELEPCPADCPHWAAARKQAPQGLHERISLEFSHTWPGQCYLRFEASGAVTMVRVNAADRAVLRRLLEKP